MTTTIDTHGGAIEILVDTELLATATADTGGFAGLVTIGVVSPTANLTATSAATSATASTSPAGSLGLKVGNTGPGERVVIKAVADTTAISVGGVARRQRRRRRGDHGRRRSRRSSAPRPA